MELDVLEMNYICFDSFFLEYHPYVCTWLYWNHSLLVLLILIYVLGIKSTRIASLIIIIYVMGSHSKMQPNVFDVDVANKHYRIIFFF